MVRKPGQKPSTGTSSSVAKKNRQREIQPRTPQERILHMGPTGKKTLIWRDWEN
jgi:hypothetical protein